MPGPLDERGTSLNDERRGQSETQQRPIELTVVVPTYNERDNIGPIVERLDRVLQSIAWEVIFVDDASPDGTSDMVRKTARADRRVRLIERHNRRGLSSAVIEGGLAASADVIAVMDGDLQHDENLLPELYRIVSSGEADIASASRFLGYDAGSGLSSQTRVKISNTGIALANRLFHLDLTDPLTGFFAIRRDSLQRALPNLSDRGFKVLLDLITSLRPRPKVKEVGFQFRQRVRGESKLDRRVMYDFFLMFLEKTLSRFVRIPVRFLSFSLINGLGVLVHVGVLMLAVDVFRVEFSPAQLTATLVSMFFNFSLNNMLTYSDLALKGHRFWIGFVVFCVVCSLGILANIGIATLLHRDFERIFYVLPALAGALITLVWNYATTKIFVWGRERSSVQNFVEASSLHAKPANG
jgi:dolichol-phosphate mannosyltransferase